VAIPANQNGTLSSGALGNGFSGNIVSGNAASVLYLSGGVSFSGTTSAQFDGFTGTINISPGATLRFSADTTGKTFGSLAPTFVIAGTLQPRDAGNTVQLGAFTGSGSLAGPQSSAGTGNILYVLGGNNTSATFSGVISSNTALAGSEVVVQKIGTGTLTLHGASTYTGGTTVKAGTLRVNNASGSGTGTGSLVVENGATLAGGGFIGSSTELESGAILAPGNSAGTLTFSGDLTLDSGTILNFELGATSDAVVVNGELSAAGIINVTALAGFGPGVYPLFTAPAGSLSIDDLILGTTPAGYNCVLDTGTSGLIKLVVTSATPPVISSVANLGGNLVMSGSNGPALGNYYVLTSTNVGAPLLNWLRLTTNHFDAGGGFNFTNPINALTPQLFYQLQLP
jgi:fibronectin-binding autotransporter adhesin